MTDAKKASLPNAIDLAELDTSAASDKGAEIELVHPTSQKGLGIFFNVLGKDSQVFRDQVKEDANAAIRKEVFARQRGKKIDPPTAEDAEEKAINLLTLCTLGWRSETKNEKGEVIANEPTITIAGEKLSFNANNCKSVYSRFIWIRRQIDEAIGDLENFIKS